MTREKAKQTFDEIDFLTWQIDIINNCIDKIYDDFEAQIKAKDKEIKNLDEQWTKLCNNLNRRIDEYSEEIEMLKNKLQELKDNE